MTSIGRQLTVALAALGGASTAGGAGLALAARSPGARAFGQQTAAWGAIDLSLAVVGSLRAAPSDARLRRVLLVNAGLDVGYIAFGAGLALRPPSRRLTPAKARGHGLAVVVQGAALLALDSWFARRLRPA